MQATIETFTDGGGGTALLDDGTRLPFDASVFAASALRHLRPGQRVTVLVENDRVTSIQFP